MPGRSPTWPAVETLLRGFGARRRFTSGRTRAYWLPLPAGRGALTVEVTLRPRWCALAVDRIRTDRAPHVALAAAEAWFETHAWPVVRAALRARGGWGTLPTYRGLFSMASPVAGDALLGLLTDWITLETTSWSLPRA